MTLAVGININIIIAGRGINHTFVTRDREINHTFISGDREINHTFITGVRETKDKIVAYIHGIILLLTVKIVIMVWVPR